jgi:hypothetical protein
MKTMEMDGARIETLAAGEIITANACEFASKKEEDNAAPTR